MTVKQKKNYDETAEEIVRCPLPRREKREMFAIANQLLGASKIKVICADGKARLARIPGRMKKREWIREGDLVIIRPWEFQDDKCDIEYRYSPTQAGYLSRRKMLPKNVDIF